MKKELRRGKVFIDWSQNDRHKTTVGVYSLRARERPTVSTPLVVGRGRGRATPDALVFESGELLERVEERGDLFEPVLTAAAGAARPLAFVPMVDWGLARQIARFAARSDDVPDLGIDVAAVAREIEPAVVGARRPRAGRGAAPPAEVVGRQEWAEANLVVARPRCSTRWPSAWRAASTPPARSRARSAPAPA